MTTLELEPDDTEASMRLLTLLLGRRRERRAARHLVHAPRPIEEVLRAQQEAEMGIPRRCRVCGCTQTRACTPPCWWVAADLCSACQPALSGYLNRPRRTLAQAAREIAAARLGAAATWIEPMDWEAAR